MECGTGYFAGLADMLCKIGKVDGIMLTNKGTTFTDLTFLTESTHHVNIASATTASRVAMVYPVINFDRTTDEVTIQTSNLGYKDKDGNPVPSALAYLDISAKDYETLQGLEGKLFDVILFTDELKQVGYRKGLNTNLGLRAKVAFVYDLPNNENGQLQYPMYLFFRSPAQFKSTALGRPDYLFTDLVDFVPTGYDVRVTTAYTSGTGQATVKVTNRTTGLGIIGLAAADFEVLESNGEAPVSVTIATDQGLGSYLLTVHEDVGGSPTALDTGEYFKLQVSDDDATYVTALSNVIKETVLV